MEIKLLLMLFSDYLMMGTAERTLSRHASLGAAAPPW